MSLNQPCNTPTSNVTVEGDFDFWAELAKAENIAMTDDCCLLTREPLTLNHITMPCGHKYNYIPICKEISALKWTAKSYTGAVKLSRTQTICPYCRKVFDMLLPKIPVDGYVPGKYVCSSTNCMDHRECQYVFQSGKRKGQCCAKKSAFDTKHGPLCSQHACAKSKAKKADSQSKIVLTDQGKKIWKKLKVAEIKDILRTNKLPVTGTKAVLISRIIEAGINIDITDK